MTAELLFFLSVLLIAWVLGRPELQPKPKRGDDYADR